MMGIMRLSLVLLLGVVALSAAKDYHGYGLYRVHNSSEVYKITSSLPGIDWWSHHPSLKNGKGDLMVAPIVRKTFEGLLKSRRLRFEVLSDNVQSLVNAEKQRQRAAEERGRADGRISFDRYYRHAEINQYLEEVAAAHPDIATLIDAGQSYEGRDMKAIKLSSGSGKRMKPNCPAGIHAREWISPAVAVYLLQQLTEGSATDLVNDVDWIILPVLNPDGYEFTFEDDRFWRKTRSITPGESCMGVDANRNFDFHWMESGASSWACDETFAGNKAFSEPEARNLKKIILDHASQIDAYITLHSYGQYILYPWGYSSDLPDDWRDLDKLGNEINDAIAAVRGTTYDVGSSGADLYPAAGASDDWSKGVAGIKYSYTIELPGGGMGGFDLPPEEIQGVVEETLEGLKVVGKRIGGN
ncbi:hypothetical protein J437_LFUL007385 [Ladona fulva]|uniref:Peptidase M14 domain-containing protein n=1 Tax=Ladona fulva TaxID=123851 RepID=A0A8K0NYT8_LADFU|nr:hypothetical protein J437_LFUL007385 [Ladona fulva]